MLVLHQCKSNPCSILLAYMPVVLLKAIRSKTNKTCYPMYHSTFPTEISYSKKTCIYCRKERKKWFTFPIQEHVFSFLRSLIRHCILQRFLVVARYLIALSFTIWTLVRFIHSKYTWSVPDTLLENFVAFFCRWCFKFNKIM